jgi:hypothetical protein
MSPCPTLSGVQFRAYSRYTINPHALFTGVRDPPGFELEAIADYCQRKTQEEDRGREL